MRHLLILATLPLTLATAHAQTDDAARQADHEALRVLRNQLVDSFNRMDIDALAACFTPKFAFTGADQSLATTRADLQAYHDRWLAGDGALLKKIVVTADAEVLTQFNAPDSGYCHGSTLGVYHLSAGPVVEIPGRWTATMQKIDGEWKVATAHVGVNVLDNPVLTRHVQVWKYAAGGTFLAGVVLGLLVGKRGSKRGRNPQAPA